MTTLSPSRYEESPGFGPHKAGQSTGGRVGYPQTPTPFFLRPTIDHGNPNGHRRGLVKGLLINTLHAVSATAWHRRPLHVSILGNWWTCSFRRDPR